MLQIKNFNTENIPKSQLDFLKEILFYIEKKDKNIIKNAINDFSEFCFNEQPFDATEANVTDNFVNIVIDILMDNSVLSMEEVYHFIIFFLNDWSRFSFKQKEELINTFKSIIPSLKDATAQMIMIEIITKYQANRKSLDALMYLENECRTCNCKYLLAYGYKLLIENTNNHSLQEQGFSQLGILSKDSCENVRNEALNTIESLKNEKP